MQSKVYKAAAFTTAFVLSATASFYANAADLGGGYGKYNPPPPPPTYSEPVDYSSWAGFYFGGVLGYGWGDIDTDISSAELDGISGGVLAGYNHQIGRLVLGIEGDILAGGAEGSGLTSFGTVNASADWSTAIRGRAGITLMPNLLVFATLGYSWADFDLPTSLGGGASEVFSGLQYGAGAEVKLSGPWSARFDYLHTDYESETLAYTGGGAGYDPDVDEVRGSIVYKF